MSFRKPNTCDLAGNTFIVQRLVRADTETGEKNKQWETTGTITAGIKTMNPGEGVVEGAQVSEWPVHLWTKRAIRDATGLIQEDRLLYADKMGQEWTMAITAVSDHDVCRGWVAIRAIGRKEVR